jgi:hypothetical protein
MSQELCRLCNTSSTKLISSISDETITNLIEFVPTLNVDVKDSKLPTTVCQLCYGKAKISIDFLVKVQSTQVELKKTRNSRKMSGLKITSAKSLNTSEVLLKMQKVGSISIRKVAAINDSVPNSNDDMIEEVEMLDDFDESSDDDINFEEDEDDDDEDDSVGDDDDDEEYLEDDDDGSDDNYEPNNKKKKGAVGGAVKSGAKKESPSGRERQRFNIVSCSV